MKSVLVLEKRKEKVKENEKIELVEVVVMIIQELYIDVMYS